MSNAKIKQPVYGTTGQPYPPVKLSLAEAGELLGTSYVSMLQLAKREDFPAFKCMGRWIVPYQKLLEWIDLQAGGEGR